MNTKTKLAVRWPLVAGYLGIVAVLLACGVSGGATATATPVPTATAESLLRLEDGAVKALLGHGEEVVLNHRCACLDKVLLKHFTGELDTCGVTHSATS